METPDLKTQVQKAKKLADKIREIVKKEWFTIYDIVDNSTTSHDGAKGALTFLARLGFIKTESREGKFHHKLLFTAKEREEIIDAQIMVAEQDIKASQENIKYLKELRKIKTSVLVKV